MKGAAAAAPVSMSALRRVISLRVRILFVSLIESSHGTSLLLSISLVSPH
jgi:hypothetical protein